MENTTARIDMQRLAILNDRLCQTLDALNQVRMSAHGFNAGMTAAPAYGVANQMNAFNQTGFGLGFAPQFAHAYPAAYPAAFAGSPVVGGFSPYMATVNPWNMSAVHPAHHVAHGAHAVHPAHVAHAAQAVHAAHQAAAAQASYAAACGVPAAYGQSFPVSHTAHSPIW